MIMIDIDEALGIEVIAGLIAEHIPYENVGCFEHEVFVMDNAVRLNAMTRTLDSLDSYRIDLMVADSSVSRWPEDLDEFHMALGYDGPSPLTSDVLGEIHHVRLKGALSSVVLKNGDIMLHDGGMMVNHSAWVRTLKQAIDLYYTRAKAARDAFAAEEIDSYYARQMQREASEGIQDAVV